jgi:hypothetical protein
MTRTMSAPDCRCHPSRDPVETWWAQPGNRGALRLGVGMYGLEDSGRKVTIILPARAMDDPSMTKAQMRVLFAVYAMNRGFPGFEYSGESTMHALRQGVGITEQRLKRELRKLQSREYIRREQRVLENGAVSAPVYLPTWR